MFPYQLKYNMYVVSSDAFNDSFQCQKVFNRKSQHHVSAARHPHLFTNAWNFPRAALDVVMNVQSVLPFLNMNSLVKSSALTSWKAFWSCIVHSSNPVSTLLYMKLYALSWKLLHARTYLFLCRSLPWNASCIQMFSFWIWHVRCWAVLRYMNMDMDRFEDEENVINTRPADNLQDIRTRQ